MSKKSKKVDDDGGSGIGLAFGVVAVLFFILSADSDALPVITDLPSVSVSTGSEDAFGHQSTTTHHDHPTDTNHTH